MKELTYSADTMSLRGPICEGSTQAMYCDVWCASDNDESEDSLFEVNPEPGARCAFCNKELKPAKATPEKRESQIFREAIELIANPHTAKAFAEAWNEAKDAYGRPAFPFAIDMSDPDAPWNQGSEGKS